MKKIQATYEAADGTKYEFQKHAFLNIEAGAQYTLGEAKFSKLLSPNIQLGLGYQFTPVFGARIQANAWQSKGGWNGFVDTNNSPAYTADYKYKYVAPGLDFMFNLSNLFCGWNPNRVFNLTAFVGGGANIAWGNDEANDIARTIKNLDAYNLAYVWDGSKVRLFGRAGLEAALARLTTRFCLLHQLQSQSQNQSLSQSQNQLLLQHLLQLSSQSVVMYSS